MLIDNLHPVTRQVFMQDIKISENKGNNRKTTH